jgi:hypothetical protein
MVESELITEHSIGFKVIEPADYSPYGKGDTLTEIMLWEGSSLTAWGANANTPLTGMKQKAGKSMAETLLLKHAAIERFCKNADITDETIECLSIYNKQLFQVILTLTNETTEPLPGASTSPDNKSDGELVTRLKQINSLFKN